MREPLPWAPRWRTAADDPVQKEKAAKQQSVRSALLAYPVLMAADILLYDVEPYRSGMISGSTWSWRAIWCTGTTPMAAAAQLDTYSELKEAVTAAVISVLDPLQQRYTDICADPGAVLTIARDGAAKAQELAGPALARAKTAIGLLSL